MTPQYDEVTAQRLGLRGDFGFRAAGHQMAMVCRHRQRAAELI